MPITLSNFCIVLTKKALSDYPSMQKEIINAPPLQNIIIADVLASYDMAHQTKTAREIERDISEQYYVNQAKLDRHNDLRHLVVEICQNHGVKSYLPESFADKGSILFNSVQDAEKRFEETSQKEDYKSLSYANGEKLSEKHQFILHYLKEKLKNVKKIEKFSSLLETTKNNFILHDENGKAYYPVVSDLIFDTFNLDYYFKKDADFTKALCDNIGATKAFQKNNVSRLPRRLYSKVVFIEQVKKYNARTYILKEYARTLKWNEDDFRKFYLEILYYNVDEGKRALLSELNIDKIFPRCFLLNKTKIITLTDNSRTLTLETMQEFATYRKLEQNGKI
jgi:hypothetical protein